MSEGNGNGRGAPIGNKNTFERMQKNKEVNKTLLYQRIKSVKQLNRIAEVQRQLLMGQVITKDGKRRMTNDDRARLIAAADIGFRLLAKTLPDLTRNERIVEHRIPDRETLLAEAERLGVPPEFVFGERGADNSQPRH